MGSVDKVRKGRGEREGEERVWIVDGWTPGRVGKAGARRDTQSQ